MTDHRLWAVMAVVVVAIWLVGAAITKYSLEQMAFVTHDDGTDGVGRRQAATTRGVCAGSP